MTLAEWRFGVRRFGAEYCVQWAVEHGLDLKAVRCLNDRSALRLDEKAAVDAVIDQRSCCQ